LESVHLAIGKIHAGLTAQVAATHQDPRFGRVAGLLLAWNRIDRDFLGRPIVPGPSRHVRPYSPVRNLTAALETSTVGTCLRELKLVIWDLDETILRGVFAEGDRQLDPTGQALIERLHERGVLQAMATQNEPEVMAEAISLFGWSDFLQVAKADFTPKRQKVLDILAELDISADHSVLVDNDPFHRDMMRIQVPNLTAWSAAELSAHVDSLQGRVTDEARRRPQMYRAIRQQKTDVQIAGDSEAFLAQCDIRVRIRPYQPSDEERAVELLTRTNPV
jgi:FkbH-like protein